MRRVIHNTTAIAACLAMLSPQFAAANVTMPSEAAIAAEPFATDPIVLAQADTQQDQQLTEEELRKQLKKAERKANKEAEQQAQGEETKADKKAERKAEKAEQKAERKAERAEEKAAEQAEKDQLKAEAKQEKRQEKADAQQKEERKQERQASKDEANDNQSRDQAIAAAGPVTLAEGDTATERAGNMGRLYQVLQDEVDAVLTEDRLSCVSGGSFPCADGDRLITPRGVVLEQNGPGNYRMAAGNEQMFRATEAGEVVPRAAEEDSRETVASREAARETRAAVAAALDDRRERREIREQRITEENRRSSSEDFATNLRDALGNNNQQRAEEDDDDNSDLVKALVLGLGAVAVGSMLNNNRQVALSTPDRVVVTRPDGSQEVIKDEVALLRQPGSTVTTEDFDDGSSRTIVTRPDGSKVVTIRDADLRVLRRTLISADGTSTQLIDDTATVQPVDIASLPAPAEVTNDGTSMDEAALRAALQRESNIDRRFTLGQVRNIPEVRALVAPVNIDAITFDTGSAAIRPDQANQLSSLGQVISDSVANNPREMFLIEGHTDTVGDDAMNLALSDRRAESVALALSEYFDVPPENLIVQGYGEQFLRVRGEGDIRANRRASVRRITELLQTAEAQ